jgi:hypothetical protein
VEKLAPNYCVIRMDETSFWSEEVSSRVESIWGVYAFDRNAHSYLCESTPSYCLRFLGVDYEPLDDLSEDESEYVNVTVLENQYNCDPVSYMHVSTITRMVEADPKCLVEVDDLLEEDTDEFTSIVEAWHEGCISFG